jgi:hypothetical protein
MVVASFLNGIGITCLWIPKVILKDILPNEKVSIWYTYIFVASCVSQAMISMGIGFLTNKEFGNIDLIYMAVCPCVISFIVLIFAILYLIESNPKSFVETKNYSWKDFVCIFDAKIIMKFDNIGILFIVLFTTFWAHNTYEFDKDNFMNHHFHWSILQTCILTTIGAVVTLILHPWGFTVNYFSDNVVIKSAMICKIVAYISIAISPMVGVWLAYISGVCEAASEVVQPLLKSLLASHEKTGERFGAVFTLRSIAGLSTALFSLFYRNNLQGTSGVLPGLHFIIAAIFIFIGFIVFWLYKNVDPKEDLIREENEKETSITI